MLADIGTKALEPHRFEILRDIMTGYALVEAKMRGSWNAVSSLMIKLARGMIGKL
jgi:hypothetical protein